MAGVCVWGVRERLDNSRKKERARNVRSENTENKANVPLPSDVSSKLSYVLNLLLAYFPYTMHIEEK